MSDWEAQRRAVADLLARIEGLDPRDRASLDRRIDLLLDDLDPGAPIPDDPARAALQHSLRELRAIRDLPADRNNVRLAEKGEVFAPEDDA